MNRDEARFCSACGVRILARCATCDSELPAGARFCDGCGAPVAGAEAAGAPVSADAGQQSRKTVTIVFADLQGSTALQEGMDPESVRTLMAGYYAAMREVVDAHAGKVVKFVGDGVMAVFGVPDVAEDDALRAVRAAAAMQSAFRPIAAAVATQQGAALALRVGVNTGEVVVDVDDADVVGDAVNVASRLESAAGGGDVLVGDETWRLTRQAARFEPVPALTVKGRAETVTAHRLVELTDAAEAGAAPFVGRSAELSVLQGLFGTVTASGQPRLATVIGSPGVGKSRLVGELHNALGDRATTLVGRVDQTGGTTFAPVIDLLRGLGDVDALVRDDPERDRLLAAVEGLSAGAGAQATPEETFWAVRRLIEIAARARPVVAVLDDVQWAEPLLLDLIEHLAEWITEPVLLIAVARPELRELRPALADPHGRVGAVIALEGLDRAATEELAREFLDSEEVPAPLLERLTAGTDGNPLFVRELVRMLVDDGVIRREGDGWTLAVEAAAVEVPPTIQSLLAARVDRLRAAERTVLERAAVIGAEVYRGALVELVPPEVRADLDNVLESLRRKELLEPAGTYWIDERVLRFHHALIREAAYRRLLKESRAGLHERVAAWLVAKTGGGVDHDESIGYHLEQAQATRRDLGPLDDDARAVAADAADRLGRAARRALDRDDLLAAAGLADRAVNCLDPDDQARAELLLTRCEAVLGAGDVAAAGPAVDELSRLAAGSARLEAWATCFDVQRTSLVDSRALADVEARLTDAAAQLSDAGDSAGAAKAHRVHASVLARLGRVGDCEAALDRALGAARDAGDRRQTTSVLSAAPLAALWGPSPVPRAGGRCLDVIRLVRITTGAPAVEATSIRCQAVLEAFRGRLDAARSLIASARAIAEELGLRHGLLEVELFAGIVELCGDDATAAEEHLRRAHEGFTAMGVTTDAAQAAALRGRASLALGQPDDALAFAATSEELGGQDLKTSIAWRAVKAEVLAARGNVAEATELAQAAVDVAKQTDALIDHADALAALAGVLRAAGDDAGAQRVSTEARALYEQKGATALGAGLTPPATMSAPAAPSAAPPSSATITNGAWERVDQFWDVFLEGRLDACEAMLSPDLVQEDRRGHVQAQLTKADWLDNLRVLSTLGVTRIERHPIAVRADNLVVTSTTFSGDFESTLVSVSRDDADGRVSLVVTFDEDDIAAALTLLDELYEAELGDEPARDLRDVRISANAHATRDWATFRASLADDVRMVDHRPRASAGEIVGRERFAEYAEAMIDVAPDYLLVTRRILGNANRCILGEVASVARSGGARYEEQRFLLTRTNAASEVDRFESYAPEQADQAWARFRELSGEVEELTNTASAAYGAVNRALLGGRPDEAALYLAPDVVRDDRRSGIKYVLSGMAETTEHLRAVVQMGNDRMTERVLSVRDEHLALVETTWGGQFDNSLLTVVRTNADGLIELAVNFEVEDLSAAFDELDMLFLAGLDDARARSLRAGRALLEAHNRRDWGAVRDLVAADVQIVDHRPAGAAPIVGGDAFVEYAKAMVDLAPEYVLVVRLVLAISDRSILGDYVSRHTGAADSSYETSRILLTTFDAEGRGTRRESFGPDQLQEAWGRYRELSAGDHPKMTEYRRAFELAMAGRFDELAPWLSPDYVYDDRREGLGNVIRGRDSGVEHFRAIAAVRPTRLDIEELATRGERLALLRRRIHADELYADMLWIHSTDEHGLHNRAIAFDPGDVRTAFEELDELYIAGEGAAHAEGLQLITDFLHSYNTRDWDGVRAFYTPDVVTIDHRPTGFGVQRGVDEVVARHRSLAEVVPDATLVITSYRALGPRYWIMEMRTVAPRAGAEPYVLESVTLAELQPAARTISRLEHFTTVEQAWARHRELTAGRPKAAWGNQASRVSEGVLRAIVEGRIDDLTSLISPTAVTEDRRLGMTSRVQGYDQFRALAGLGITSIDNDVKAVRGERLMLSESVWRGDFEVRVLTLVQLDEHGRIEFSLLYEPDQLVQALEDLDEQYVAGEGARLAAQLGYVRDFTRRYNARDWDGLRAFYTADIVSIDRRPAGAGAQYGAHEVIARHRALGDLAPDAILVIPQIYEMGERFWLAEMRTLLPGHDGQGYELHSFVVEEVVSPAGPMSRIEYFATLDEARARYDELAATTPVDGENAALAMFRRWCDAMLADDAAAIDAVIHPDFVLEDRRPMFGSRLEGRQAAYEWFAATRALGLTAVTLEPVAFRGDRLVLTRRIWHVGDNELNSLGIGQADSTGRCVYSALYDPDQVDDAIDDLNRRYLEDEGAVYASWLGPGLLTNLPNHNSRDRDRLAAAYDAHIVYVDHRPAGAGELHGVDAVLAYHQAFVDLAPTHRITARRIIIGDGRVTLNEFVSTSDEAGAVGPSERVTWLVTVMTPDGRVSRMEQYAEDDADAARARLAELSASAPVDDNVAMDAVRRWVDAMGDGDWDTVEGLIAEDYRLEDRRPMFGTVFPDREAVLAWFRATSSLGLSGGGVEAIAMRGDRLALYRRTWMAQDLELTSLCVLEMTDDGRAQWGGLYEPDQFDEAIIELEERFLAGEGAPYEPWLRASLVGRPQAHAARDWDALREIYAPEIVLVDHRPAGSGEYRGVDAVIDYHRAMVGLAPTHRQVARRQLAIANRVVLAELVSGSDAVEGDVGRYEVVSLLTTVHDPSGHPTRMDRFGVDQLDAAWAKFHELAAVDRDDWEGNRACAGLRQWFDAFMRRDWDEVGRLFDPGFIFDDRRAMLGNRVEGRAAAIDGFRGMTELGLTGGSLEPMAWRAELLALVRLVLDFDGYEVTCFVVGEYDDQGIARSCAVFDADDLDAALDELDERYLAGEGKEHAQRVGPTLMGLRQAYNARRWDAVRETYAPNVVFVDHRHTGAGRIEGADAVVDYHRAMAATAPDHHQRTRRLLATTGWATLVEIVVEGGGGSSSLGHHETVDLLAGTYDEIGRLVTVDRYSVDDAPAAWARYRELAGEG